MTKTGPGEVTGWRGWIRTEEEQGGQDEEAQVWPTEEGRGGNSRGGG